MGGEVEWGAEGGMLRPPADTFRLVVYLANLHTAT